MTKRTHEIAHALREAGLTKLSNPIDVVDFVAKREIEAEMRGLENEDTEHRHRRMQELRAELGGSGT